MLPLICVNEPSDSLTQLPTVPATQKTLYRWYLTQYHFSKIYPGHVVTCWRSCGSTGTIEHILWFCRSICPFWRQIFFLISSISYTLFTPNPLLALLHLGIEKFPPSSRVVVIHLLLAAKLNITILLNFGKCQNPPLFPVQLQI